MPAQRVVGILARRQPRDVDLQPGCQQQFAGSDRRLHARRILIETQDDLGREPFEQGGLGLGQRRAAGGDDRTDAGLECLGEIEVALDQNGVAEAANGGLGATDPGTGDCIFIEETGNGVYTGGLEQRFIPKDNDWTEPVLSGCYCSGYPIGKRILR